MTTVQRVGSLVGTDQMKFRWDGSKKRIVDEYINGRDGGG